MKKEINQQLDIRGLFVPITLLKATQAFRGLDPGDTLEIVGSDSETREDLFKVLDASRFELIALQDEAERRDVNMCMFKCRSVSLKGDKRVWENLDEYWKGLFFRYRPGLHYIGNPHETLVYPNEHLRPLRTDLIYEHVKQENIIWHRGL